MTGREVGDPGKVIRARKPTSLPVVMTRDEVKAVLSNLTGDKWLMSSLMCGAGLRLMECLRMRVQDIDFSRNEILGHKDVCTTMIYTHVLTMGYTSVLYRLYNHCWALNIYKEINMPTISMFFWYSCVALFC